MSSRIVRALFVLASVSSTACVSSTVPGMVDQPKRISPDDASLDELARVQPPPGERALLVVFPKTACSGTARMIVLDDAGTFYGAIAPGEAALLEIPENTRELVFASNVEILVTPRTWFFVDRTTVPAAPGGLVLRSAGGGKLCGNGHYAWTKPATKEELEAAIGNATAIRWRAARRAAGQAWIEEHRARVDELVAKPTLARLR